MEKYVNWNQLDKSSKMVIYAFDHAAIFGNIPGLENPGALYERLIPYTDAMLTSFTSYKKWAKTINQTAGVLRCDGGWSPLQNSSYNNFNLYLDCSDARKLGAKGVICMAIFGDKESEKTLANVAKLARSAKEEGIFVIGEVLFNRPVTLEERCAAVRITSEWGVDVIKTEYPGNVEDFKVLLNSTHLPVVVLGGQRKNDPREILEMIAEVMKAGGNGVAIGRNVFQQPNPEPLARAIYAVVHENASVEDALAAK
ncbi:MAG: hypothetical protein AAGU15_05570 [Anaerolineaceae bacterium]|jgi:DhnA family fructose-bisphosphate aldolase class Ia